MMKMFEIKGFWGFVNFVIMASALLFLLTLIPVSITWVSWNAIIGELFEGPMIDIWQAMILTGALLLGAHIIFKPQIEFQIRQANSLEDLEESIKSFKSKKDTDSTKKS